MRKSVFQNDIDFRFVVDLVKPYYNEKHRSYHDWKHIERMLTGWHTNPNISDNKMPFLSIRQSIAILFHDISYVPGSKTNEEDSVTIFDSLMLKFPITFLKLLPNNADVEFVRKTILDTKWPHVPSCEDAKLVLDLDLLGFSFNRKEYVKNNEKIEAELGFLPFYKEGRIIFLKSALSRRPFYYTKAFKTLERAALKNIEQDLKEAQSVK